MDYPAPESPAWLVAGFVFLPVIVVALALWGLSAACRLPGRPRRAFHLSALGILAAMGLSLVLAAQGKLASFNAWPPPFLPLTALSIALWTGIAASPLGRALAALPLPALLGFHAFRLPLELLMHAAADAHVMPRQMSYSGWNFDILTGATAVTVALFALGGKAPRRWLLAWNAMGTLLLITIVTIAILSIPPSLVFGAEPERANTWVAYAPYIWLPTVLVPAAAAGHVVLWRRLLSSRSLPHATAGAGAAPAPP